MRLSINLNGTPHVIAAVDSPGYLSVHLNLHDHPKDHDDSRILRVEGVQTLEVESVRFDWPKLDLKIGDRVEIGLLEDGQGDPPSTVRKSSESPRNLFSHPELAKELLALLSDFESRLMALVHKSEGAESAEEHKRFTHAVGRVLYELGESFWYPVYRRHKELVPDDLKGELL